MKINMKYKITQFYVATEYEEKWLIYHTRTTSLIVLDVTRYQEIFVKQNFEFISNEEFEQLISMGFIVPNQIDEVVDLKRVRREEMNKQNGLTHIVIAVTMACNARCFYCFENGGDKSSVMTESTADDLIKFIDKECVTRKLSILWFGGEPLMNTEIINYISKRLRELGIEIRSGITTNGLLLDDELVVSAQKDWNLIRIQITLDGIGDEYNTIKNYRDKSIADPFLNIINNIKSVLKYDISIKLRINFDPLNYDKALRVFDYLEENVGKHKNLYVYPAPIDSVSVKNVREKFPELDIHPYILLLNRANNYNDYTFDEKNSGSMLRKLWLYPMPYSCEAEKKEMFSVGPKGDIYKCHRLLGRGSDYSSGTVNKKIESDIHQLFCVDAYYKKECTECNLLPLCQGGCKSRFIFMNYAEDAGCLHVKGIVQQLLVQYANLLKS